MNMKTKEKIIVNYVATSIENHIDCYGYEVIRAGEKFELKNFNEKKLAEYKKTGTVTVVLPYAGSASYPHYRIRAKLKKITTKITTTTEEEDVL